MQMDTGGGVEMGAAAILFQAGNYLQPIRELFSPQILKDIMPMSDP